MRAGERQCVELNRRAAWSSRGKPLERRRQRAGRRCARERIDLGDSTARRSSDRAGVGRNEGTLGDDHQAPLAKQVACSILIRSQHDAGDDIVAGLSSQRFRPGLCRRGTQWDALP